MEHVKRTPIILLLCLLSFFSCKPTEVVSPNELNFLELEAAVKVIPEFQLYLQARTDANEALLLNLKNLDKKDARWIEAMHNKYPSVELFISEGQTLELSTYKELTGLDLVEGDQNINAHFQAFMNKLQLKAPYNSEDLATIIFPDVQQESVEKFFPTCSMYCTYEAGRQQRRVYSQCIQNIPSSPSAESICSQKAEIAFQYYLASCIKRCSGF